MKKSIFITLVFHIAIVSNAQLTVSYLDNVSIGTESESFEPMLMVGNHNYFESNNNNIGVAGTPEVKNINNIGVLGKTSANSSFSSDKNYGILGIVDNMNNSHGRNYGLCGMINNPGIGNFYGGAGIYATCYDYYYYHPDNIQGAYAAYFSGNVYVSGNLRVSSLFTPSDQRLCDNVITLGERDRNGRRTLDNLLNMNIVEYNLKSRLNVATPENIVITDSEKLRTEYEYLKREDLEMSCRRHFGIDAQELQKIYPDLVLEGKDGYFSVNYLEMVPLVVRSIQELKQEIDEVKKIADE